MKNFILILAGLFVISFLFLGCKRDAIRFNRESGFAELMKNVEDEKPTVRKSSGIVIYKDNEKHEYSAPPTRSVGPDEPNFDIKVKF